VSDLVVIPSRSELDARAILERFVAENRLLKPLGSDQAYESNAWLYGHLSPRNKAKTGIKLHFTRLDFHGNKLSTGKKFQGTPFNEPFLSFAKAILNHLHTTRGLGSADSKLTALRYMEYALRAHNGNSEPWRITPHELNFASHRIAEKYDSAYNIGNQLELIYKTMVDEGLVALPSEWKTFIPPPELNRRRSGKEFDAERNAKLPAPESLLALAHIRNHSESFADHVICNIAYLNCSLVPQTEVAMAQSQSVTSGAISGRRTSSSLYAPRRVPGPRCNAELALQRRTLCCAAQ